MPERLVFKNELLERVPFSYPTIIRMMKKNKFPRSVVAGTGGSAPKIAWYESEVEAWLAQLPRSTYLGEPDHVATVADHRRVEGGKASAAKRAKARSQRRRLAK